MFSVTKSHHVRLHSLHLSTSLRYVSLHFSRPPNLFHGLSMALSTTFRRVRHAWLASQDDARSIFLNVQNSYSCLLLSWGIDDFSLSICGLAISFQTVTWHSSLPKFCYRWTYKKPQREPERQREGMSVKERRKHGSLCVHTTHIHVLQCVAVCCSPSPFVYVFVSVCAWYRRRILPFVQQHVCVLMSVLSASRYLSWCVKSRHSRVYSLLSLSFLYPLSCTQSSVCCNMLQCVARWYSVMQCVSVLYFFLVRHAELALVAL